MAGAQTISQWTRDVLLKAGTRNRAEQVIVAELIALRSILLNVLFKAANRETIGADEMQRLIERADADKFEKAGAKLRTVSEQKAGVR
jgi:hypothetical protein